MTVKHKWATIAGLFLAVFQAGPAKPAVAGTFEVSLGFSYHQSNYGSGNFQWNRRYGASIGYYFLSITELEFGFQDVYDRTKITGYQDTTFHDQIFSLNLVQVLAPKTFPIQPYVKVGAGQLIREATGTYSGGSAPPQTLATITGILGAGLKIQLIKQLGLRAEASTYLTGGVLSTWQDNWAITSGLSLFF